MAAAQKPEQEQEITTAQLPAVITSSKTARALIQPFLPEGVSLDRVAASVRLAIAKARAAHKGNGASALEQCSPMSVLMAVAKIAQLGLEVGETAHLVPFGKECVPVADYKGLAQLVIASGLVRQVEAHCVYEKEPFRIKLGTTTEIEHHPIGNSKARGEMIGAYALFRLRGGFVHVKYMDVAEINAIRTRYSKQWKEGKLEPWYAEKTVLRQGVKLLPKDPRMAQTLERFEQLDAVEEGIDVPEQLRAIAAELPMGEIAAPASGPRALTDGGYGNEAAPAEEIDASDWPEEVSGELALGEERSAPTRRRTSMDVET